MKPTKNGTFSFNIVRKCQVSKHKVIYHPWMNSLVFWLISINYLLIIVSTNWNRPKHCVTSLQCSSTFRIVTAIDFKQVFWQYKRLSLINIYFRFLSFIYFIFIFTFQTGKKATEPHICSASNIPTYIQRCQDIVVRLWFNRATSV